MHKGSQHSIKELLIVKCCVGLTSHPLALSQEHEEIPCPLHGAPRERGGQELASFEPLCRLHTRSLWEATEERPWALEAGRGGSSFQSEVHFCSILQF